MWCQERMGSAQCAGHLDLERYSSTYELCGIEALDVGHWQRECATGRGLDDRRIKHQRAQQSGGSLVYRATMPGSTTSTRSHRRRGTTSGVVGTFLQFDTPRLATSTATCQQVALDEGGIGAVCWARLQHHTPPLRKRFRWKQAGSLGPRSSCDTSKSCRSSG